MNRYQDYVVYIKKDEPLINALGALVDFSIIGLIDEDGEIVDVDKVLTENTVKLYALHLTKVIIESRSTWESYDLGELEISILTYEEVIKEALEEMGLIVYGEISTNYYNGRFQGEFYNEETEFLIEIVNLEYGNSDYRIFRKDDNDFGYYLHNGFHVKDEQGNFIRLTSDNYQEENMILYDIRGSYIDVVINIGDDSYDWKVYYNEFEYNINDF